MELYFNFTRRNILKIACWLLASIICILLLLFVVFSLLFQRYEVFGESYECDTNIPFASNFSCKLDTADNNTQFWSFESNITDDLVLPYMMARINTYHWSNGEFKARFFKNTSINVCEYNGHFSKLFANIFLPGLMERGNLIRPCPLSGMIYLRNFQFQKRGLLLPRNMTGKWLLDVEFYLTEFEGLDFSVQICVNVKPIKRHLFGFALD